MQQKPTKILVIENNHRDVRLIRDLLANSHDRLSDPPAFELLHAENLKDGLTYLQTIRFDVILLNPVLPDSQNLGALRYVQEAAPEIPVLLLDDEQQDALAAQAIQQGAQDVLTKEEIQDSKTLLRALRYAVEYQRLHVRLRELSNELEASQAQRQAIIERNADGIIIINKQGIIRFVNPAAELLLRDNKENLLGKPFRLPRIKGDTAELTVEQGGKTASVEMRLVETEWEGEKVYQASLRDITEHKTARAEISQRADELAVQNMALNDFAHTMAHQVQGLLGQMIGYTSYLQMHYADNADADVKQALSRIVQSGHKMNNVINELLLLASLRSAEVPIHPLNMARIVAEVQKRLRFQISAKDAVVETPEEWPTPMGHSAWIEEALLNYINNAVKYGGEPPLVRLGSTMMSDGMVKIWVQDNGIGISPEDQRRLFVPHTRLHQMKVSGEGLGLSIVRRIIERCNGRVGVESEPDKGSTFWFTLPLATDQDLREVE